MSKVVDKIFRLPTVLSGQGLQCEIDTNSDHKATFMIIVFRCLCIVGSIKIYNFDYEMNKSASNIVSMILQI